MSLAAIMARPDLLPVTKLAAWAIASGAGEDGVCRLPLHQLRALVGLPDSTMRRALSDLATLGWAEPEHIRGQFTHWRLASGVRPPMSAPPSKMGEVSSPMSAPPLSSPMSAPPNETGPQSTPPRPPMAGVPSWFVEEGASPSGPPPSLPPAPPSYPPPISPPSSTTARTRRAPTRLPEGWTPDAKSLAYVRDHCPLVDVSRELVRFGLYWREGKGYREMRADWPGTWRNWCDRAEEDARRRDGSAGRAPLGPASPPLSAGMMALRKLIEDNP